MTGNRFATMVLAFSALAAAPSASGQIEREMQAALKLFEEGRFDEASNGLKGVIALRPSHAEAHAFLGHAAFALDRLDEARAAYRRAVELGRTDAAILARLAQIDDRRGAHASTLAALRAAALVSPDEAGLMLALAESCAAAGLFDEAEIVYRQLAEARPADADVWLRWANLSVRRGREDEALTSLATAFHLGARSPAIARSVGGIHARAAMHDEAALWYGKSAELGAEDAEIRFRHAQALADSGDIDSAVTSLLECGRNAQTLLIMGGFERRRARYELADDLWREAARLGEVPPRVRAHLGVADFDRGRFSDAARHLAEAWAGGETTEATLRLLVKSHLRLNAREKALASVREHVNVNGLDRTAINLIRLALDAEDRP